MYAQCNISGALPLYSLKIPFVYLPKKLMLAIKYIAQNILPCNFCSKIVSPIKYLVSCARDASRNPCKF
jgi:hypothetical protein